MTLEWVITILLVLQFALGLVHRSIVAEQEARHEAERQEWRAERQQLLDRIQAPSFGELKQAEVKIIKAQQGTDKEPPPLVPL